MLLYINTGSYECRCRRKVLAIAEIHSYYLCVIMFDKFLEWMTWFEWFRMKNSVSGHKKWEFWGVVESMIPKFPKFPLGGSIGKYDRLGFCFVIWNIMVNQALVTDGYVYQSSCDTCLEWLVSMSLFHYVLRAL